jgi:excisionase family DNA binding protein
MKDYLSIGEASRYCGLSISTLRRMEEDGRLKAHHRPSGGIADTRLNNLTHSLNNRVAIIEKLSPMPESQLINKRMI